MESIFKLDQEIAKELDKIANEKNYNLDLELLYLANKLFVINKDGKRFLDLMKEKMVLRRETASPDKDAAYAYYTAGENNVIRQMSYFAELYPYVIKSEKAKIEEKSKHKN
ncbi:hypothetical protein GAMM_130005 [Gammaproteobacteria bacterium]